jgi:NADPH2:quinone reductase
MASVPETMTAVAISTPGGPDVLVAGNVPTPKPGPGQILVKVAAAGVNRPDVQQRIGAYPPPAGHSPLPGLEVAGTVAALGGSGGRWMVGDKVCALVNGGGYAEYTIAEDAVALPIPGGLDMVQAGAVPETFFTVWNNVFERGRLTAGEWFLVHGGTSGIGTTAIQLGRAFGATMIGTAGSDEKCTTIERLGATAINYRTTDFVQAIRDLTSGRGVDVILDIIGGSYLQRNLDSLAMNGRLLQVGLQGGAKADINLAVVMQRHLTLTGSLLRPRTPAAKGAIARELEVKVWPLLAARQVKPIIDRTYPLASAAEAHRALESGEVVGKVVLTI